LERGYEHRHSSYKKINDDANEPASLKMMVA